MRCAVYCRLSREDEKSGLSDSESIKNQKSLLINHARERGWEIYAVYSDDDYSGSDRERPGFCRMLRDAQDRRFDIILCKSQARFTRDMELVERYIHGLFPRWGIRFVAIADGADTEVAGNKKARQINGLINEWYLEDLSRNVRMVLDMKRREGQYIGGRPLLGYLRDPADKHRLIIDPEGADIVRRIFALAMKGYGKQHIAALLNRQGVPSPAAYKALKGYASTVPQSGLWSKTAVGRILSNEMYTGTMVQGCYRSLGYKTRRSVKSPPEEWFRVSGTHPAIIPEEVFLRVQNLRKARTKECKGGKPHALAGIIFCHDCGSAMHKTRSAAGTEYLVCSLGSRRGEHGVCSRHGIRLDALLRLVGERLREHMDVMYDPGSADRFQNHIGDDPVKRVRQQLQENARLTDLRDTALKQLYLDRAAGMMDEGQHRRLGTALLREKAELQKRRQQLEQAALGLEASAHKTLEQKKVLLQKLLEQSLTSRELLSMAVQRIEISERDKRMNSQQVEIFWRF